MADPRVSTDNILASKPAYVLVTVCSAKGLVIKKKPDLYCKVQILEPKTDGKVNELHKTRTKRVVSQTMCPEWDERVLCDVDVTEHPTAMVYVRCMNKSLFQKDDRMGGVNIPLRTALSSPVDNWFPVERIKEKDKVAGQLHIRIFVKASTVAPSAPIPAEASSSTYDTASTLSSSTTFTYSTASGTSTMTLESNREPHLFAEHSGAHNPQAASLPTLPTIVFSGGIDTTSVSSRARGLSVGEYTSPLSSTATSHRTSTELSSRKSLELSPRKSTDISGTSPTKSSKDLKKEEKEKKKAAKKEAKLWAKAEAREKKARQSLSFGSDKPLGTTGESGESSNATKPPSLSKADSEASGMQSSGILAIARQKAVSGGYLPELGGERWLEMANQEDVELDADFDQREEELAARQRAQAAKWDLAKKQIQAEFQAAHLQVHTRFRVKAEEADSARADANIEEMYAQMHADASKHTELCRQWSVESETAMHAAMGALAGGVAEVFHNCLDCVRIQATVAAVLAQEVVFAAELPPLVPDGIVYLQELALQEAPGAGGEPTEEPEELLDLGVEKVDAAPQAASAPGAPAESPEERRTRLIAAAEAAERKAAIEQVERELKSDTAAPYSPAAGAAKGTATGTSAAPGANNFNLMVIVALIVLALAVLVVNRMGGGDAEEAVTTGEPVEGEGIPAGA